MLSSIPMGPNLCFNMPPRRAESPPLIKWMTTVELSQHTIKLEPPQRLLMLEVVSEKHGFCLRMFPADGVEVNGLRLVSKSSALVATTGTGGGMESMALMRRLSEAFPTARRDRCEEIPQEYRITFGSVESSSHFEPGERYRISGVGEQVWETTAVAK